MSAEPTVVILDQPADVTREAAKRLRVLAREAIAARGRWILALAGGSTPKALYRLLAESAATIEWPKVEIFFGDERCVPPEHADSNYAMAREAMLGVVSVPPAQVHRMRGEAPDPAAAAAEYEADLARTLGPDGALDVALLGMGADGHTASLFPATSALRERTRLCTSLHVAKLGARRLTLTYPVFEAAREVLFLIAGGDKAETLQAVVEGPRRPELFPSQPIVHRTGPTTLLCDRAAASELATAKR